MEPAAIERVIAAVGAAAASGVEALVQPVAIPLASSFIVLSIVMLGVSLMLGGIAMAPLIRLAGAATGTLWVITEWGDIVRGTLDGARNVIALVIPGYTGPSGLFGMATEITGRIELEAVACGWNSLRCVGVAMLAAITGPIVWIGLAFTGLLATIAEFQLLIGAVAAPLILPALAFPLTSQLGWGVIYFLVKAGVRVVVMGITSFVMAEALTATVTVTGTTGGLNSQTVFTLVGLAVLTMMVGLYVNSIANDLVGGGAGSLGYGAARNTGSMITSVGSSAASAAVTAGTAAAGTAAAAARLGASATRNVASIGRGSSGSAFK